MKPFVFSVICGLALFSAAVAGAVPVGLLSFDVFVEGTTNAFDIGNLTGSFGAPPVFPVSDALTFVGSHLNLVLGDGTALAPIPLGDIGPGFLAPPPALEFPGTTEFSSATFTATLSQTTFLLSDGSTFLAASPLLSATLLPSSSAFLVAGLDSLALDVAGQGAAVPEPASLLLIGCAAAGLWVLNRRRGR